MRQIIFIGLLIGMFLVPVYATSLSTDSISYQDGDTIILTGSIIPVQGEKFISVQIWNPSNSDFVQIDSFEPNSDGTFSRSYKAAGPKWAADGTYTLKLFYNQENFQTTFDFSNNPSLSQESESGSEQKSLPSQKEFDEKNTTSNTTRQEPKTHIPGFPALDKSPQHYFDRYNNEESYKEWFDFQFPNQSIQKVVGYSKTNTQGFPNNSKSPQHYIDRYNNEESYKEWFDFQFPENSIYQVLGFPDPLTVPDWIKNIAKWWSEKNISDQEFLLSVQFMIENNIIVIPDLPESQRLQEEKVPDWIRTNADWWAQDKISEQEFVNTIKYLVQKGIIII